MNEYESSICWFTPPKPEVGHAEAKSQEFYVGFLHSAISFSISISHFIISFFLTSYGDFLLLVFTAFNNIKYT